MILPKRWIRSSSRFARPAPGRERRRDSLCRVAQYEASFWSGYAFWVYRRPPQMFIRVGVGTASDSSEAIAGPIPSVRSYEELREALLEAEQRAKRALALPREKIRFAEPGALYVAAKITKRRFGKNTPAGDRALFAVFRRFRKGTVVQWHIYRGLDENGRQICRLTAYVPSKVSAGFDEKTHDGPPARLEGRCFYAAGSATASVRSSSSGMIRSAGPSQSGTCLRIRFPLAYCRLDRTSQFVGPPPAQIGARCATELWNPAGAPEQRIVVDGTGRVHRRPAIASRHRSDEARREHGAIGAVA